MLMNIKVTGGKTLAAIFGRLDMVGNSASTVVKREAVRQTLKIEAGAEKLAPRDKDVSLVRSGQSDVSEISPRVLLATVSFGGLAAAYAEVQHERDDFAHSEQEYASKYGHALSRIMTDVRGVKRKHKITGYQGGQAHFLEGREDSAWNTSSQSTFHEAIADAIGRAFERAMRQGGVD